MKKRALVNAISILTVFLAVGLSPYARAQDYIKECGANLKYDLSLVKSNFAYRLALSDTVNENNINDAQTKANVGVIIDDVPANIGIDQYNKDVTTMSDEYKKDIGLNVDNSILTRAVSKDGWAAYSACITNSSTDSLLVWISGIAPNDSAHTETVTISIKTNLPAKYGAFVSVVKDGITQKHRIPVNSSGSQSVQFIHPKGEALSLAFNLQEHDGIAISSKNVILAKDVHVSMVTVDDTERYDGICKAGDHNSTRGNLTEPLFTFTPAPGAVLLDDYRFVVDQNPIPYPPPIACSGMNQIVDEGVGLADDYGWHRVDNRVTFKVFCEGDRASTVTQACASYHATLTERTAKLVVQPAD